MQHQLQKLLILFFVILHVHSLSAQVTIGSSAQPNKGSLLDIKEKDSVNGEANSTKGLLLPRVYLTSSDSLTDLGITDQNYPKPEYNGIVIYNVTDSYSYCANLFKGIYTWMENKWVPVFSSNPDLGADDVGVYVDLRDPANPEEYKYRSFGEAGVWMIENMRALVTPNGVALNSNMNAENGGYLKSIPSYMVPQTVAQLPALPETDPTKVTTWRKEIGLLYNWAAATVTSSGTVGAGGADGRGQNINEQGTGEGTRKQGICPTGWHLPSDREWTLLENEIIRNTSLYTYNKPDISKTDTIEVVAPVPISSLASQRRGSHGLAMIDYCSLPKASSAPGASKRASHGGFAAIPAGYYTTYNGWKSGDRYMYFSTSSQSRQGSMWYRYMSTGSSSVTTSPSLGADDVHFFFSVRCKRD